MGLRRLPLPGGRGAELLWHSCPPQRVMGDAILHGQTQGLAKGGWATTCWVLVASTALNRAATCDEFFTTRA